MRTKNFIHNGCHRLLKIKKGHKEVVTYASQDQIRRQHLHLNCHIFDTKWPANELLVHVQMDSEVQKNSWNRDYKCNSLLGSGWTHEMVWRWVLCTREKEGSFQENNCCNKSSKANRICFACVSKSHDYFCASYILPDFLQRFIQIRPAVKM